MHHARFLRVTLDSDVQRLKGRAALALLGLAALTPPGRCALAQQPQTSGPVGVDWSVRFDSAIDARDAFTALVERNGVTYAAGYAAGLAGGSRLLVSARAVAGGASLWTSELGIAMQVSSDERVGLAVSADGAVLFAAHALRAPFGGQPPLVELGAISRFSTATGQLLSTWTTNVPDTAFDSLALSPDGSRAFACRSDSFEMYPPGIACFDAQSGAPLWQTFDLGQYGIETSSVVVDPGGARVYGYGPGGLTARDAATGAVIWSASGKGPIAVSPTLGRVYTGAAQGAVVAYDSATGAPLGSTSTAAQHFLPDQIRVDANERIFALVATTHGCAVRAFDAALSDFWSQVGSPATPNASDLHFGPGDAVYATTRSTSATPAIELRKIHAASGALAWSQVVAPGVPTVHAALATTLGTVCVASNSSTPQTGFDAARYDFDAQTGQLLAMHVTHASGSADQIARDAVPSPDGTQLFAATARQAGVVDVEITGLAAADGAVQWSRAFLQEYVDFTDPPGRSLAASSDLVFVHSHEQSPASLVQIATNLRALERATGAPRWELTLPLLDVGTTDLAVGADEQVLYAGGALKPTHAVEVRAHDAQNGASLWTFVGPPVTTAFGCHVRLAPFPGGDLVIAYPLAGSLPRVVVQRLAAATGIPSWQYTSPVAASETATFGLDCVRSPDGARLYVMARVLSTLVPNGLARVVALDAASGSAAWTYDASSTLEYASRIAVSPNGRHLALSGAAKWHAHVVSADGQLEWDLSLGAAGSALVPGQVLRSAFDPTSSKLYFAGFGDVLGQSDPRLAVGAFAVEQGAELWAVADAVGGSAVDLAGLSFDPNGTRLYVLGSNSVAGSGYDLVAHALELPALTGTPATLSLSAGGTQSFDLAPGAQHAFDFAWVLGTASADTPGFAVGNLLVPLNPDAYFQFTLEHANSGVLPDSLGLLDQAAHRSARFTLPPGSDPAFAGLVGHHAFVVVDSASFGATFASNAVSVTLLP